MRIAVSSGLSGAVHGCGRVLVWEYCHDRADWHFEICAQNAPTEKTNIPQHCANSLREVSWEFYATSVEGDDFKNGFVITCSFMRQVSRMFDRGSDV
jgi:hypothetical protein